MKKYIAIILLTFVSVVAIAQQKHVNLLIGTYTNTGKSEGIYVYDFDTKNASTRLKTITKNIINPNFLSLSPDQKYVYVANEIEKTGSVSAFGFNAETGTLTLLNTVSSQGLGPCHVTADDQNVLVANYRGGSLAVFNRLADGSLSGAVQMIKHTGKSVHPGSQTSAHVHQNQFSPDHQYVLSNDLGEDLT
ncbi:MAG: lactonase family protein, partial [Flavobacteriales bacterium]